MAVVLENLKLSETDLSTIASVLDQWIHNAVQGRQDMEMAWKQDLRDYEARPRVENKNYPWPGCSNINIPLKSIFTDAIWSRLHRAIHGREKLYRLSTYDSRPEVIELSRALDDCLNFEANNRLKLSRKTKMWEWETILLGTGFLKGAWKDFRHVQMIPQQDGDPIAKEVFDAYGPAVDHVPIEDILIPMDATALNGPDRCQFIDHVKVLRWDQLVERKQHGYEGVDEIKEKYSSRWSQEIKDERDHIAGIEKIREETFDIHEVWCNFPVCELDKYPGRKVKTAEGETIDREFVELVITYHPESRTILRVMENWFESGIRPFFALNYIPRSSSVYGIGVGRMVHYLNEAVNTTTNQRTDNATIANMRIWKCRKGALPRGVQVTPGKILYMDDPNDLQGEQLGDVYPSSYNTEAGFVNYAERRVGVSDYQLGRESSGNYQATATSTMSLIEEGNIRWDFTLDDWRESYSEMGMWILSVLRQFDYATTDILDRQFGPEKADTIREALSTVEQDPTYALFSMDLMVTKASDSEQAQMQRNQVLFDVFERFYMGMNAIVRNLTRGVDENGVPITQGEKELGYEMIQAQMALAKRILHSFQIPDTESYLPNLQALEQAAMQDMEMQQQQAAMMAAQGGMPGAGPQPDGGGDQGNPQGAPGGGRPPSPTSARQQAGAPGGGPA